MNCDIPGFPLKLPVSLFLPFLSSPCPPLAHSTRQIKNHRSSQRTCAQLSIKHIFPGWRRTDTAQVETQRNSYCSISKNKKNNTKTGALNVLVCCVALVDSGQVNTTPVYRLSTQLLLPLSPASRVETFLPGLLWISKMAILVHTAVMLIACGGLESEGGGAMSLFACFSEKCRGAQRSRQRSTMTDLRLHVASLAYRCYRF